MINIINYITDFIGKLTITDMIFFALIMGLIIISLTIIILMIRKKEVVKENTYAQDLLGLLPDDKKEETVEAVSELEPVSDEPEVLLDLATLTAALENQTYDHIDREVYEKEEEEKAIISYDELLETTGNLKINYVEETDSDGISVKKVDLTNLTSNNEVIPHKTTKVQLVSYEKEEAFLEALKELQHLLE